MTTRILVADDHASVRRSLRTLISQRSDWLVCAEAENGVDAVQKAKSLVPNVVLLDLAMEGLNGVEAAEKIRAECPATIVLTMSMYDAEPLIPRLQAIGVKAFIPKNNLATELLPAIAEALAGRICFPTAKNGPSGQIHERF
jgi:DNA-binding NarL/FixJ family response regulator